VESGGWYRRLLRPLQAMADKQYVGAVPLSTTMAWLTAAPPCARPVVHPAPCL